jgi:hypothetical protein
MFLFLTHWVFDWLLGCCIVVCDCIYCCWGGAGSGLLINYEGVLLGGLWEGCGGHLAHWMLCRV